MKVYGRSVTLSFLHNRLLFMWKPAGRLDCVDLGYVFFLTQFYLRDDYEAKLKKGPWFIGEHFSLHQTMGAKFLSCVGKCYIGGRMD